MDSPKVAAKAIFSHLFILQHLHSLGFSPNPYKPLLNYPKKSPLLAQIDNIHG